jgi:serine/threonine-protein kinase
MIGTTLGHYQVLEKIGHGGMGIVYRAKDVHLGRDVALKVLTDGILADDTAHRRFRNEARTLSRLSHPNIAVVYDFSSQEELDFLVLELIPGKSLSDVLRHGPLPEEDTTALGLQLADGLAAAHDQGIIHRDIKPANLFVVPDGRLKILDFGLAQVVEDLTGSGVTATRLTESNRAHGTLPYMSPEQLRGERADFRSDVYSAGVVLYEMATGQRLIQETTLPALVEHVLDGMTTPPRDTNPDVSPELDRIIVKCLARSPGRRFQTARELRVALRQLATDGASASRSGALEGVRRWPRIVGGVAAASLLVAIMVWVIAKIPTPSPTARSSDPIRSLVVLPLENLSGVGQQFFADGMTDMLIMDLARIGELRVISRTSAMHYQGTDKLLPEIAEELGVDAAVEGTVLRSGDRVRITVQLVDARKDRAIWADRYERDLVDVLQLQGDVARAVARNVEVALSPGANARLGSDLVVRPAAYDAYLKGRHFLGRRSPAAFVTAIEHLERAVREDPLFAPAHAELANGLLLLGSIGYDVIPPVEAVKRARIAADTALEIDEESAPAWTALAHIRHNVDWDWAAAEEGYRRAIELNPGYATAHQWYGFFLASRSRLDEAVAAQRVALEIDPLSPLIHASLGRLLYYRREHEAAARHFEQALELDPGSLPALLVYGMVHLEEGRYERARELFESGQEVSQGAPAFLAGVGACHGAVGDTTAALAVIDELAELANRRYVPAFYRTPIYAKLGDMKSALDWLERAYEERSEAVLYLAVEPLIDALRAEPRFRDIAARVQ